VKSSKSTWRTGIVIGERATFSGTYPEGCRLASASKIVGISCSLALRNVTMESQLVNIRRRSKQCFVLAATLFVATPALGAQAYPPICVAADDAEGRASCLEAALRTADETLSETLALTRAIASATDVRTEHTRAVAVLDAGQEAFLEYRRQHCLLPLERIADEVTGALASLECEVRITRERVSELQLLFRSVPK
jgi:uncharacterized protein YecT (DUF1311 family)